MLKDLVIIDKTYIVLQGFFTSFTWILYMYSLPMPVGNIQAWWTGINSGQIASRNTSFILIKIHTHIGLHIPSISIATS